MHPILFSIGPIAISSFGFFSALAFLLASFLIWKFAQEQLLYSQTPFEEETLFDSLFVFTLATLFGARLIFVLSHFNEFGFNFLRWLLVREINGFSFLAGFLIGGLLLLVFSLKKKLDFWSLFDIFSLGLFPALSLIFIGAFLDGVGAGAKTDFPWGVLFVGQESRRHPVQLLAVVFFLIGFLILKKIRLLALKKKLKNGVMTLFFLFFCGLALFLLEFFKEGEVYWNWFRKDQLLYLAIALVSGFGFYQRLGRSLKQDFQTVCQFLKLRRRK